MYVILYRYTSKTPWVALPKTYANPVEAMMALRTMSANDPAEREFKIVRLEDI